MRKARVKPRCLIRGDGVRLGNVGRGRTCLKRVGFSHHERGLLDRMCCMPVRPCRRHARTLASLLSTPVVFVPAVAVPEGPGLVRARFHLPDTPGSDSGAGPLQFRGTPSCRSQRVLPVAGATWGHLQFSMLNRPRSLLSGSSRGLLTETERGGGQSHSWAGQFEARDGFVLTWFRLMCFGARLPVKET